jgi:hypothetical protein
MKNQKKQLNSLENHEEMIEQDINAFKLNFSTNPTVFSSIFLSNIHYLLIQIPFKAHNTNEPYHE